MAPMVEFEVDGRAVSVPDDGDTLLGVLRDRLGLRTAKDGCSPQGQCGCCTVLVDGQPRVACVTPARRVKGRAVTTLDGLPEERRVAWGEAMCATGGSQCGFCTPGIVVRLEGLSAKKPDATDADARRALQAHLCRCTGWHSIVEAWDIVHSGGSASVPIGERDLEAAERRAELEGGVPQTVSSQVALGAGGFADDQAPADALVAVAGPNGEWFVAETLHEARQRAGKVQGRRTTLDPHHPLEIPDGDWDATLQTTWVEPAYLETDASWAEPGGVASNPLGNGGAFGGKLASEVPDVARRLADEHGRPVRVLYSREDVVQRGPKRPPVSGGMNADGRGLLRVARTPGIIELIAAVAPGLEVEEVDLAGPATSAAVRGAGWIEACVLGALATGTVPRMTLASGAWAEASLDPVAGFAVRVGAGEVLDEVVLRSYCLGAVHMAHSLVRSEALAIDAAGVVHDLTVRSFGILRAIDMPAVNIEIVPEDRPAAGASDAVMAVAAAASALVGGPHQRWPLQV